MNRIKLSIPQDFLTKFTTELSVRITDLNYGNHLGNQDFLSYCHEARMRFLNHYEMSELDCFGRGIIQVDAAINYTLEGNWADKVKIEVFLTDIGPVGFDLFYLFTNLTANSTMAKAKTGLVFYDYSIKKVAETPKEFSKLFEDKAQVVIK
jgi:acyl-CoA thioester hydrolase